MNLLNDSSRIRFGNPAALWCKNVCLRRVVVYDGCSSVGVLCAVFVFIYLFICFCSRRCKAGVFRVSWTFRVARVHALVLLVRACLSRSRSSSTLLCGFLFYLLCIFPSFILSLFSALSSQLSTCPNPVSSFHTLLSR